ncbi:MAG: hypothetical protein AB8B74_05375 [Crocinitomicaceae bacterium]
MDSNQTKMTKTPFGLHVIVPFRNITQFEIDVDLLKNQSQKYVWLKGDENEIQKNLAKINEIITQKKLSILVDSEKLLESEIHLFGFISIDFESIKLIKSEHPSLKVGGIADNLADAKNVELLSGDFVYLGALDQIGHAPYIAIIPRVPDYEWQFIDITIPVLSFGFTEQKTLTELTQNANLFGHCCDIKQFRLLNTANYRFINN